MKRIIILLVAFLTLHFMAACAFAPPLSPEQKRMMQTKTFESTNYENVFRSAKNVLQDDGYIIKNQDFNGGLIVGSLDRSTGGMYFYPGTSNNNDVVSRTHEVSINIEKISESIIETRLSIQEMDHYRYGGQSGNPVLKAEDYRNFYERLSREINRRQLQGRG